MSDEQILDQIEEAAPPPLDISGPADADRMGWWRRMSPKARPYLSLSRFDRPVGFWLLALPCWAGLAIARIPTGWQWLDLWWAVLFGIGAVAMRGAGCTWNDITDREIDAEVERTAGRPLPAGMVSLREAYIWLAAQLFVGLLVLLCLPMDAKIVALMAVPLVVAYPFMKRITWWPQAWLGMTFNWGIQVGAATAATISPASLILFLGFALWTIAYDTIYALQDREDDALIGVRSTARLFGNRAGLWSFAFHAGAAALIGLATSLAGAPRLGGATAFAFLLHGLWQARRISRDGEGAALSVFKSNVWAGAIVVAGLGVAVWV